MYYTLFALLWHFGPVKSCNFLVFCRLREMNTLKGHVESVVRMKGLDIDTIQQSYTV